MSGIVGKNSNRSSGVIGTTVVAGGEDGLTNNSNTTWMTVSADEEINMPLQPHVFARTPSQPNSTGDGTTHTVVYSSEIVDQAGNFDGTSTFTAPCDGHYLICTSVHMDGITAAADGIGSNITTSNRETGTYIQHNNEVPTDLTVKNSAVMDLDAGDTAIVTARVIGESSNVVDISNSKDYFTITLLV